jgi:hypothetical protein
MHPEKSCLAIRQNHAEGILFRMQSFRSVNFGNTTIYKGPRPCLLHPRNYRRRLHVQLPLGFTLFLIFPAKISCRSYVVRLKGCQTGVKDFRIYARQVLSENACRRKKKPSQKRWLACHLRIGCPHPLFSVETAFDVVCQILGARRHMSNTGFPCSECRLRQKNGKKKNWPTFSLAHDMITGKRCRKRGRQSLPNVHICRIKKPPMTLFPGCIILQVGEGYDMHVAVSLAFL